MSRYILHLAQVHETFRKPELEALAALFKLDLKFLQYSENKPFAIVTLPSEADATKLVKRSILSKGIYEYWGSGTTYTELHSDVKERTKHLWTKYNQCSFRFEFESFRGTKSQKEQKIIIEDFAYLGFDGPIKMNNPDERFSILEEYDGITHLPLPDSERSLDGAAQTSDGQVETEVEGAMYLDPNIVRTPILRRVLFGRYLASSSRPAIETYDLKKRKYIGTTSMDAELSLITANLAQVSPGKIVYDPFVGTGSFVVASAHFGGMTLGSDIDGRAIRGAKGRSLFSNFVQYNLVSQHLDSFVSDLTNSPFRNTGSEGSDQFIDAIVCDPPYGIREGLKVLGARDLTKAKEVVVTKGVVRHLQSDYIPPKRPYSFDAMLVNILDFAVLRLVPNGRLCLWMPAANEDFSPMAIPTHPELELMSVSVQVFYKWSRRLLTYRRLTKSEVSKIDPKIRLARKSSSEILDELHKMNISDSASSTTVKPNKPTADDLNNFRKRYFEGFKTVPASTDDANT